MEDLGLGSAFEGTSPDLPGKQSPPSERATKRGEETGFVEHAVGLDGEFDTTLSIGSMNGALVSSETVEADTGLRKDLADLEIVRRSSGDEKSRGRRIRLEHHVVGIEDHPATTSLHRELEVPFHQQSTTCVELSLIHI